MDLSSVRIEVCQPNRTVAGLVSEIFEEAGARVNGLDVTARTELADVFFFDVDALSNRGASVRLADYRAAGVPVILCGLRHLRIAEEAQREVWLDRPFSGGALLYHCACLLGIPYEPVRDPMPSALTRETREEPIRELSLQLPTREVEIDEASLLEEEFGLEPGVLGGRDDEFAGPGEPTANMNHTAAIDLSDLEEIVDEDEEDDDEYLVAFSGGKIHSPIDAIALELDDLDLVTWNEEVAPPAIERPASTYQTMPDMPKVSRPSERTVLETPGAVAAEAVSASVAGAQGLDDETSMELRSFARMLAESYSRIGLAARSEDRFDRLNRVLHALFEKGLDGAANELGRIPQAEGFSGSIRALSLVGLFRTIRDRKLRGRLEISTVSQAFVLYLDGGWLDDIDALAGDSELMLLEILRAHDALDDAMYQRFLREREDPDALAPPVEMRLRMEGLVTEAALNHARRLRAEEIFRRTCSARNGNFSFIEIYRGDAHAWPVHQLRLNVDELLLAILREDSLETGVSEATSRAVLQPNMGRLVYLNQTALDGLERELLRFFAGGRTLAQAHETFAAHGAEFERAIERLKRADLLHRVTPDADILSPSGEFDAARREREPTLPAPPRAYEVPGVEQTVIVDLDARELDARSAHRPSPLVTYDPDINTKPTRAVSAFDIELPLDPSEPSFVEDEELERLLEQLSSDSEPL